MMIFGMQEVTYTKNQRGSKSIVSNFCLDTLFRESVRFLRGLLCITNEGENCKPRKAKGGSSAGRGFLAKNEPTFFAIAPAKSSIVLCLAAAVVLQRSIW